MKDSFATALAPHLGPSLDRLGGIHLIRRLDVRLRLTQRDWTEGRFLEAACRAFSEALFRALARPASVDPAQRAHYESSTAWRAALIRWLLTADREQAWHFDLPHELRMLNARKAALLLLLEEPSTLAELASLLHAGGTLRNLAAEWDDLETERIFLAFANARPFAHSDPVPEFAFHVLRSALNIPPPRGNAFASRQHALLVFAASPSASVVNPETFFHVLQAARWILEEPRARSAGAQPASHPGIIHWRTVLNAPPHAGEWQKISTQLVQHLPAAARRGEQEPEWIGSRNAGVFLLAPIVSFLRWTSALGGLSPRMISALLGAVFQSAIGSFDPAEPQFDLAASLAAGLGVEQALREVRALLASADVPALARAWKLEGVSELPTLLEQASRRLLLDLGARLRGFRQAPADAVARAFIRVPGRIQITDERLRVVLDAFPYSVALRISGCDGEQPRLPWLEPRTITLFLEGL